MRSIETIVLVLFAVIVAGMVLSFSLSSDYGGLQEQFNKIFFPKNDFVSVNTVDIDFALFAIDSCWQKCGFGSKEVDCGGFVLSYNDLNDYEQLNGVSLDRVVFLLEKKNFCVNCGLAINSSNGNLKAKTITKIICDMADNNILLLIQ